MKLRDIVCNIGTHRANSNAKFWNNTPKLTATEFKYFSQNYSSKKEDKSHMLKELTAELMEAKARKQQIQNGSRALEKDFIVSVLSASVTKRETKSYLQRFLPAGGKDKSFFLPETHNREWHKFSLNMSQTPNAVKQSPKFEHQPALSIDVEKSTELHVALVKIRAIHTVCDDVLDGIGKTLSQLSRLGLTSIVALDFNSENGPPSTRERRNTDQILFEIEHANRLISAFDKIGETKARLIDNIISIGENQSDGIGAKVEFPDLLMAPIKRGIIPVILPIGYTNATHTALTTSASDIILALTKLLVRTSTNSMTEADSTASKNGMYDLRVETSIDRLIILDPLGGIPASNISGGYHVFLNMEQEFDSARKNLLHGLNVSKQKINLDAETAAFKLFETDHSSPFKGFHERELELTKQSITTTRILETTNFNLENLIHIENLSLAKAVLSKLPPSSSALLTSLDDAANSAKNMVLQPTQVGTRRQLNPLIHNLLTDKPIFSSSLPASRRGKLSPCTRSTSNLGNTTPSTFVKHGMPIVIFPKLSQPTLSLSCGQPKPSLTNPEIDLDRLIHLIEDSFGRTLDVPSYLSRINSCLAGVIIAGSYEGCAILTWETPPGIDPSDVSRKVPYIDKFAVLKRSQGVGGVADLIFKAIVRDCLPSGVAWRSRSENMVNKWYFERSRGSWRLPDTGWTMFWTTPEVTSDKHIFLDYEAVCRGIPSSWSK
ncbi:BgTH12-04064 [Blumeria graminis f. sp. triticale]|uniref:Amino-acid acetyltransferase, mitochondrial n=1 Tax=Blumeria graminis f. sp. triticale TaxID=1689686 RepID=A0A9W4GBW6_BLUGR|nr:BgTH12-04064 [Blumeria graminis f. sp. triticale]